MTPVEVIVYGCFIITAVGIFALCVYEWWEGANRMKRGVNRF